MNKKKRIELLDEILAVDTANDHEQLVADILTKHLKKAGIKSKEIPFTPGRNNLVAEIGDKGPVLGLSGHMDVVPSGAPEGWATPPFTPTEKDGKIYGRGATDMKSGVAALIAAMIELVEEGAKFNGKVRFFGTVGEETGLYGAKELTDMGYADDLEGLIIGEPTGHRIVFAHKGVFTYSVTSRGKSAHSSIPELGINAIDNLLIFYNKMMEEFGKLTEENSVLGKMVYCNSVISGGQQFNMVPDFAKFTANLRTIPEVNNDRVQKILEDIVGNLNKSVKDMKLVLEITQSHLPMFSDIDSKLVQTALDESTKMFGETPPTLGAPSATDAAEFIKGNKDMQVIIYGPGNETMHQVDEYVEESNYLEMIDLYKNIIVNYFNK